MGLLTGVWRSAAQARTDRPERWRRVVDVLSVDHRARAVDLRRAAHSGIGRVWAHTIRTPAARDRALRLGCDGVMTDTPRRLARAYARTLAQAPPVHSWRGLPSVRHQTGRPGSRQQEQSGHRGPPTAEAE
jgi:glycerophosphoryl diester phosphodiesterase